ncbi:MAG: type I DNA topoisomerase [Patescibacteria group bacterium]
MDLIIVESPTKARTLSQFLGGNYQIVSTMGHIRDLPEKKFGIKTDKDFEPQYVLIPGKSEIIENLKAKAKKADKIFLATDPDREGETIAWHVGQILREKDTKILRAKKKENHLISQYPNILISRITFHEITKSAIEKALDSPRGIDMDLVSAQQARRILDRIVGYKLSPLLWFKIRKGLSAGRVQSVAVRLIVDREREIEKFVPVEYWEIYADLKKHLGGKLPEAPVFSAKLGQKNGQKIEIRSKEEADGLVLELEKAGYEVKDIEKREVQRFPSPPFTTSTLQQQGALRLGWPAKKTMRTAQDLYEKGLITYHRTDSTNIAKEAIFACRAYIKKTYGEEFLPEAPRIYKTKSRVAQEAHEAIRPTDVGREVGSGKWEVGSDEKRLYELIWKRFVACQMKEAIYDETKVSVLATGQVNHFLLEALGKIIKFAGWLTLYGKGEGDEEGGRQLPELNVGDDLDLMKIDPLQKFTQPPPRYNEASLIKTLEEYGIGRPSTYAPIISTIQERQYVEKIEGRFQPSPLGFAVNDFLVEYFPDIVDLAFTAHMEDDLDEVANGKKKWVPVVREFYIPFNTKLTSVSKIAERVPVETEVTDEKCPDCGAPLVVRIGRYGKFLSCSRFPQCKFTKPYLRDAGFTCQKCGAKMVVKKSKKGKTFYGCSNWPACNFATWRKPKTGPIPEVPT